MADNIYTQNIFASPKVANVYGRSWYKVNFCSSSSLLTKFTKSEKWSFFDSLVFVNTPIHSSNNIYTRKKGWSAIMDIGVETLPRSNSTMNINSRKFNFENAIQEKLIFSNGINFPLTIDGFLMEIQWCFSGCPQ